MPSQFPHSIYPATIDQTFISGQDASSDFESPVINLSNPVSSLCFQLKWDSGVLGTFTWYASVFKPYVWEPLVSCGEDVTLIPAGVTLDSSIISLPSIWLTTGYIKFAFVKAVGSTGDVDVALRTVPL